MLNEVTRSIADETFFKTEMSKISLTKRIEFKKLQKA